MSDVEHGNIALPRKFVTRKVKLWQSYGVVSKSNSTWLRHRRVEASEVANGLILGTPQLERFFAMFRIIGVMSVHVLMPSQ